MIQRRSSSVCGDDCDGFCESVEEACVLESSDCYCAVFPDFQHKVRMPPPYKDMPGTLEDLVEVHAPLSKNRF